MIIYKITNLINNRIYIGITTNTLKYRWLQHISNSKKGITFRLYKAMRKHGIRNFKIEELERVKTFKELCNREEFYIKKFNTLNPLFGYNMVLNSHPIIFSKKVREKMSKEIKKRFKLLTSKQKKEIYEKSSKSRQGLKRNNSTGYVGVCLEKGRYTTYLTFQKKVYRSRFVTAREAAEAYDKLALYFYGENARINFLNKRKEYLRQDLELFLDFIVHRTCKMGRPSVRGYSFSKLLPEAKKNAVNNMVKIFLKTLKRSSIKKVIEEIFKVTFRYDGEIYSKFFTTL